MQRSVEWWQFQQGHSLAAAAADGAKLQTAHCRDEGSLAAGGSCGGHRNVLQHDCPGGGGSAVNALQNREFSIEF